MSIEVSGSYESGIEIECDEGTCKTEVPPSLNARMQVCRIWFCVL